MNKINLINARHAKIQEILSIAYRYRNNKINNENANLEGNSELDFL